MTQLLKAGDAVVLIADPSSRGVINAVVRTVFGVQYQICWTHGLCAQAISNLDTWKVAKWTNPDSENGEREGDTNV